VFAAGALRVATHDASVGDTLQPGGAVFTWTGTDRVVTAELDIDDQPLAEVGTAVTVTLPDGSSQAGEVADVESVVQESSEDTPPGQDSEQETMLEVTVAPSWPASARTC
jgi:hypothetical protein